MSFWSKRPALSDSMIAEIKHELAVMRAQRKSVKVEEKQTSGKRKFDFDRAAEFFVDNVPTSKEMQNYMGCTKMTVYLNVKRPEFINAVRALGYDGKILLRTERRVLNRQSHLKRKAK